MVRKVKNCVSPRMSLKMQKPLQHKLLQGFSFELSSVGPPTGGKAVLQGSPKT